MSGPCRLQLAARLLAGNHHLQSFGLRADLKAPRASKWACVLGCTNRITSSALCTLTSGLGLPEKKLLRLLPGADLHHLCPRLQKPQLLQEPAVPAGAIAVKQIRVSDGT